jgi:hypothetical protein
VRARPGPARRLDGSGAVGCLADHLDPRLSLEERGESPPDELLVVDQQDADVGPVH